MNTWKWISEKYGSVLLVEHTSPKTGMLYMSTHMKMPLLDYCFRTSIIQEGARKATADPLGFTQKTHSQSSLVIKPQVLRQKEYTVESNSTAHLQLGSVKESKIKFHVKQLIPIILFYFHPPSNFCSLLRYHLKCLVPWNDLSPSLNINSEGKDWICLAWQIFYVNFCWMILWVLLFSCQVGSDSLWPYGLQHARLLCPHYLWVYSNSCSLNQWCYPTILSSAAPFSFCLQLFPTWGYFPISQLFTSGGQNIYEYWTQIK